MKKKVLCAVACAMTFSANADVVDDVMVNDVVEDSAFDSIFIGFGFGGSFLKSSDMYFSKDESFNAKAYRLIGSFSFGGGRTFSNNVYLGVELKADFAKDKEKVVSYNSEGNNVETSVKMSGLLPQVGVRLGYVFNNGSSLAYTRFGYTWSKIKLGSREKLDNKWKDRDPLSKQKASFVVGVGFEKSFCRKVSSAFEVDYNLGWKWKGNGSKDSRFNKGWTVRALAKYHVSF